MNVETCRFSRYRLPLVRPLTIGGRRIEHRDGVIITLTDSRGCLGYGEITPLPGLHRESLDDVLPILPQVRRLVTETKWPDRLDDLFAQTASRIPPDIAPGIRCGIEMALTDLAGLACNSTPESIEVCGLVMPTDGDLCDEVQHLIEQGYRTVKIKVARQSPAEDAAMIRRLQEAAGHSIRLRLDANRGWSLQDALQFCDSIDPQNIEYIEEPVAHASDLAAFCAQSPVRPALDETLVETTPDNIANPADLAALILKPAVLGGFAEAGRWIRLAAGNAIRAVISCCFESSVAVRSYAAFAAWAGIADAPAGLDTLKFLAEDLLVGESLIGGGMIELHKVIEMPVVFREGVLEELKVQ